jgi:hypothetical protein
MCDVIAAHRDHPEPAVAGLAGRRLAAIHGLPPRAADRGAPEPALARIDDLGA